MTVTKEEIYDAQINPLMAQIIAICKEHKIPVLASFTLDFDEGLHCTTALLEDEYEPADSLVEASRVLLTRKPSSVMMLTERDAAGKVTKMTAIL